MIWLKLALGLVSAIRWIMKEVERRRLLTEGERRAIERAAKIANERLARALEARKKSDGASAGSDDSLPDDGYRRE